MARGHRSCRARSVETRGVSGVGRGRGCGDAVVPERELWLYAPVGSRSNAGPVVPTIIGVVEVIEVVKRPDGNDVLRPCLSPRVLAAGIALLVEDDYIVEKQDVIHLSRDRVVLSG